MQPVDEWLKLNVLYKYEKSIDCIRRIKNQKALIKWHSHEINKEEFEGEMEEPLRKKIHVSYC